MLISRGSGDVNYKKKFIDQNKNFKNIHKTKNKCKQSKHSMNEYLSHSFIEIF